MNAALAGRCQGYYLVSRLRNSATDLVGALRIPIELKARTQYYSPAVDRPWCKQRSLRAESREAQ